MKMPKLLPTWCIIQVRDKGCVLGRVQARDADEAIKVAIEEFSVPKQLQYRLIAQRVE